MEKLSIMKTTIKFDTMNHKASRRVFAAAIVALAAISASSCAPDPANVSLQTPAEVIVSSPVDAGVSGRSAALGIFTEIDELNMPGSETDFSDEAQVEGYVGVRREVYTRLMAVELDEIDADAKRNIRFGCEQMLEYLDELPAFCRIRDDGSQEASDMRDTLSAKWASAIGRLDAAREALQPNDSDAGVEELVSGEAAIIG
jgi:hypothetical protein